MWQPWAYSSLLCRVVATPLPLPAPRCCLQPQPKPKPKPKPRSQPKPKPTAAATLAQPFSHTDSSPRCGTSCAQPPARWRRGRRSEWSARGRCSWHRGCSCRYVMQQLALAGEHTPRMRLALAAGRLPPMQLALSTTHCTSTMLHHLPSPTTHVLCSGVGNRTCLL